MEEPSLLTFRKVGLRQKPVKVDRADPSSAWSRPFNDSPVKKAAPTPLEDSTASSDQLSQGSNDASSGARPLEGKPLFHFVVPRARTFENQANLCSLANSGLNPQSKESQATQNPQSKESQATRKPQSKESQATQNPQSKESQATRKPQSKESQATQNPPRQSQPSQPALVDATTFGTTRSASHQLVANRIGQVKNQPNTQSNQSRFTRPSPIDATSLAADPSISSHTVIHRVSENFRTARKGGRIGTTGGVRRGNSSRDDNDEFKSQGNHGNNKRASRRPKTDHQKDFVDHHEELSSAELEYMRDRQAAQRGSPVPFKPEQPTAESLSHMAPALAISTQGMSEIVLERLRRIDVDRERIVQDVEVLARMKVAGLTPRFENQEQKGLTMKRVEQLLNAQTSHNGDMEVEKEREGVTDGNNKHDIPEVIRNDLVQQLVSGTYNMQHPAIDDGRDILGHVGRLANRNGTYRPTDEQSLLQKIQSLLSSAGRPSVKLGTKRASNR